MKISNRAWAAIGASAMVVLATNKVFGPGPDSTRVPEAPAAAEPAEDSAAIVTRLNAAEDRLRMLAPKFRFNGDAIRGGGWFVHRWIVDQTRRPHLAAPVHLDGTVYMRAYYTGDEWIFADRIVARVGGRVLETGVVRATSGDSDRNVRRDGTVQEWLHFIETSDGGILAAIAATPEAPALVRFEGRTSSGELSLSAGDRRALAEAFTLGSTIRELGLARSRRVITEVTGSVR